MSLLEEIGILGWGTKEKGDRRAEVKGQHPSDHQELGKKQHQEPLQMNLGHPEVHGDCDTQAVSPRSQGGIDVHRVSPAERDCVPPTVSGEEYQH